ncbi:hypothetical protein BGZ76_005659 [Entomortierella beljakovae]|nr:hypothetical protein BGZ76_005659 [Entomortierella beljakovae]
MLSRLYIIQSLETRSKFLLKVFPDQNYFNHPATSIRNTKTSNLNVLRDSGCSLGIQDQENQVLKEVVRHAIENEIGAMKWFQSISERSVVPEILGFSYFGCETSRDECPLESFGLLGLLFMRFPQNGTLYQGPASECRIGNSAHVSLSKSLAKVLHDTRKEQHERVSGFSIHAGENKQKNGDLIVDILDRKSSCELSTPLQPTSNPRDSAETQRRPSRSHTKRHQRNGSTLACIPENTPQAFSRGESINLSRNRRTSNLEQQQNSKGKGKPSSISSSTSSLPRSSQGSLSPDALRPPRFPSGFSEIESFHPHHSRVSNQISRTNDKRQSSSRETNSTATIRPKSTSIFDQDPTVYCSGTSERQGTGGNRGEIMRIEYQAPQSLTTTTTRTTTQSSSQTIASKISSNNKRQQGSWMEENYLCWPTKFVRPVTSTGYNFYDSAIEYEQAHLFNSLVALGKLDSFPGSTCRFPRRLLDILQRILPIAHDELLFSGSHLDLERRRRILINAPVEKRIYAHSPSVFANVTSVFTHGHLDPNSIVINNETGEILSIINFQHAGFLPSYSENPQSLFIESNQLSFWNTRRNSSSQDSSISESSSSESEDTKHHGSWNIKPKLGSILSSLSTSTSRQHHHGHDSVSSKGKESLMVPASSEHHEDYGLIVSPRLCNMQRKSNDSRRREVNNKGFLSSSSSRGPYWASYPVINHYPSKDSQITCESKSYSSMDVLTEYSNLPSPSRVNMDGSLADSSHTKVGMSDTSGKNKKGLGLPGTFKDTKKKSTQDQTSTCTQEDSSNLFDQQNGLLTSNIPKLNQEGWAEFMEGYRELERKSNKRQSRFGKIMKLENHSSQARSYFSSNTVSSSKSRSSPLGSPLPPSPSSPSKSRDTRHFERDHDSEVLEALTSINKTLQNLVVTLEAGGNVLTPKQLLNAISRKKSEFEEKERPLISNATSSNSSSSLVPSNLSLGVAESSTDNSTRVISSTSSTSHGSSISPKEPLKKKKKKFGFFRSILERFTRKRHSDKKYTEEKNTEEKHAVKNQPLNFETYKPTRTSADNILYTAPGVQRDPLPSELPDHIFSSTSASNPGTKMGLRLRPDGREEVVVPIGQNSSLGSMAAPAMPVYGIQLSNHERTKSLVQVKKEKLTEMEKDIWKEFEGLCEPLSHGQLLVEKKYPGIALLDLDDLEKSLEMVENHIMKLEGHAAKHFLDIEKNL